MKHLLILYLSLGPFIYYATPLSMCCHWAGLHMQAYCRQYACKALIGDVGNIIVASSQRKYRLADGGDFTLTRLECGGELLKFF